MKGLENLHLVLPGYFRYVYKTPNRQLLSGFSHVIFKEIQLEWNSDHDLFDGGSTLNLIPKLSCLNLVVNRPTNYGTPFLINFLKRMDFQTLEMCGSPAVFDSGCQSIFAKITVLNTTDGESNELLRFPVTRFPLLKRLHLFGSDSTEDTNGIAVQDWICNLDITTLSLSHWDPSLVVSRGLPKHLEELFYNYGYDVKLSMEQEEQLIQVLSKVPKRFVKFKGSTSGIVKLNSLTNWSPWSSRNR